MKKLIITITVLFTVFFYVLAQTESTSTNVVKTSIQEMNDETLFRSVTRELSEDCFGGRKPLTKYEAPTIDYIVNKFKEVGLEPVSEGSYLQKVPLLGVSTQIKNNEVVVAGVKGTVKMRYWDDIVAWTMRAEKELKINNAEFIFVGFGINAPEYEWNDYANIDVKGKVVVMLVNDPGFYDDNLFRGKNMTYYGRWSYKFEEAGRQGAAAALIIHDTAPASYDWSVVQNSRASSNLSLYSETDNKNLVAFQGWVTGESAKKLFEAAGVSIDKSIAAAKKKGFKSFPLKLKTTIESINEIEIGESANVAGILPGTTLKNEYIIYSAHWDHLGIGQPVDGDSIYNGANDNASGIAALVLLAKRFKELPQRPERSILFLAVTAEESGLLGSEYYVENPLFPLNKTVVCLNIDSYGDNMRANNVTVSAAGHSETDRYVVDAAAAQGRKVTFTNNNSSGGYYRSDHFNFAKYGVPVVLARSGRSYLDPVEVKAHRDNYYNGKSTYHQPSDEYHDWWNVSGSLEDIYLFYGIGLRLANDGYFPKWNDGIDYKAVREKSLQDAPALKLQYDFPAGSWEKEALPLGNGKIGAMLFGGIELDVIQMNIHSLWSGGPGKNPDYNGAHIRATEEIKQNLQNLRTALQDKMTQFSEEHAAYIDANGKVIAADYLPEDSILKSYINALTGDKTDFGSYQSLGNINIADENNSTYTNYYRELDIDRAISKVIYTREGINYKREYFISHPDNALVIRLTADQPGSLTRTISLTTPQTAVNITAENGTITMTGKPLDHGDAGLKFAQQVKVKATGGHIKVEENKILVENADEILILSSAATNYQQCMDDSFNYFSDQSPLVDVQNTINEIENKNYSDLRTTHVNDYQSLFNKMSFSLSGAANSGGKTTYQLLAGYKNNTNLTAENLYLEQLYYQFGRYLFISSSRKNGLPANLQGIWAEGLAPPWASDYHTNINIQMNYWLAEQTNLTECHWPVIEYTKSLVSRGRYTASYYYCKSDGSPVRGWTIHHENNLWGHTGPGTWYQAFYFPAAAAWMCQEIWEYYNFNQDKDFLEEYFPIMLEAALFWVDNLWKDSRDGKLVANPSYSPEHGPYSLGASCDQAIITEIFDMVLKASKELNLNIPEINEIATAKNRLAGPQIGLAGQFMEWKDELLLDITGDGGHRHVNHLFWLHPGTQIVTGRSPQENQYTEAMKKTLNTRGDGGTGWSKAWKINFWARLQDGNRSHKLLEELLKESTLTNLFDTHPPFQIDGNFGATAGMTEMLVQSHGGYIELFPALPDKWSDGNFKGIKARGNFELSANWTDKTLRSLEVISNSGKLIRIKYKGIKNYTITQQGGGEIIPTVVDDNFIEFETTKGATYLIMNYEL